MFIKSNYLIKEHASILKVTDTYDIIDPETNTKIAEAKENVSGWIKFGRLLVNKKLMPTTIEIKGTDGSIQYSMKRGVSFFTSKVDVLDKNQTPMGYFKSRMFSFGGHFDVYGSNDTKIADVKGKWTGWEFKFTDTSGNELGTVSKKWAGFGKELFTSADNYMISLSPAAQDKKEIMPLLIMAGIAIDVVFKEKK